MRRVFNTFTEVDELIYPAVMKSLNMDAVTSKGAKKTEFLRATVEVVYPSGTKKVIGAMLWKPSYDADGMASRYAVGEQVDIAVQIEGEHRGKAKIQLPELAVFDLDELGDEFIEATSTKEVVEEEA